MAFRSNVRFDAYVSQLTYYPDSTHKLANGNDSKSCQVYTNSRLSAEADNVLDQCS